MKVFNGKKAAEDYMSAHTLAFSTPELTLTRFAFWLGDIILDPSDKESSMPIFKNLIQHAPVSLITQIAYNTTWSHVI